MKTKPIDYQTMNAELEEILAHLQNGDYDIDQAVQAYARGMELVEQLENYVKTAENTIHKLTA